MTNPQQYHEVYQAGLTSTQLALGRFLKEDGKSSFDSAIWKDKPNLTATDVNKLLDQGASGLEWFRLALVRYHRVWGLMQLPGFDHIDVPALTMADNESVGAERIDATVEPDVEIRRLEDKYYNQQRSMNLESLRTLSTTLQGAAKGTDTHPSAEDITRDLNGVATAVPEVWQGKGGVAATDHLAGYHAHASQQTQYLQAVSAALQGLPEVLLQIVKDKATFIAGFDTPQCPVAGHAMRLDGAEDPVSPIITVASGDNDWLGSHTQTVIQQFHLPDLNTKDNFSKFQEVCKDWLINHFGPAVREAFKAFVHECALADYYIRQAYKPVTTLLDSHDTTPFPTPGQPSTPGPSTPGPSTPGPSTPGPSTPGPSTTPAATTPAATTAASSTPDLSSVLSGLSQLSGVGQSLGQSVTQGISALSSQIQQGLDGILGQHNASQQDPAADPNNSGGGGKDGKPAAEFDVAGKHMKIGLGPHGELQVEMSDSDGHGKTYELKLDEHGEPVISTEEHSAGDPKQDPRPTPTDPAPGDPSDHRPGDQQPGDQPPGDRRPGDQPGQHQPGDPGGQHQPGDQPPSGQHQPGDQPPGGQPPRGQQPPPDQLREQPPAPDQGQHAPPPGTMPPPRAHSEGDRNEPRAAPPAPAQPFDSGAELSEAGPL
ncbi:hypothetical protein [Nocardia blacklockiae]|uniref:hypothetical protein n=1 Tax=Nocardia blacklockiae TaxID=480036 RepID=UPI001893FB26|nr:hypothetical protein [Nocardia blacklockiae]MBF6172618.1 hypothetical protein [Nocardia blacklockiae]